ncbi:MAG: MFS transporter [Desulfovibrio sp.]
MTQAPPPTEKAARGQVLLIAAITAACVAADAMLYVVLPVHWQEAGLSSLWQVGILLSLNRLVRLPINPAAGWCFSKVSSKTLILLACLLAIGVSCGYVLASGFALWAGLRAAWGVAWSFLKLGGLFTVMDAADDSNRGRFMGLYTGTYRLGSLAGMLGGGIAADIWGLRTACACGIALALMAFALAALRLRRASPVQKRAGKARQPSAWKELVRSARFIRIIGSCLMVTLVIEGFLAATLSAYVQFQAGSAITFAGLTIGCAAAAGAVQSLRWSWNPVLSPMIGRIFDGSSHRGRLFAACCWCSALLFFASALRMPAAPLFILLLGIELCSTALITLGDALAADLASGTQTVLVITAYTFACDLGAALGPMGGYAVINLLGVPAAYAAAGALLAAMALAWTLRPEGPGAASPATP